MSKGDKARWPRKGDKMRFLNRNGYDHELAEAQRIFAEGQELVVVDCDVGDWSHSIRFEGHNGRFNGVMFELMESLP